VWGRTSTNKQQQQQLGSRSFDNKPTTCPSTMAATPTTSSSPAATSTTVEECEAAILAHLANDDDGSGSNNNSVTIEDTFPWSVQRNLNHVSVVGAIKSLLADAYVRVEDLSSQFYTLEEEGAAILEGGSQESRVFGAIRSAPDGRMTLEALQQRFASEPDVVKIGMGNCMRLKWIQKDPADGSLRAAVESVEDRVQRQLLELRDKDFALTALDDKVRCSVTCRLAFLSVGLVWLGLAWLGCFCRALAAD
jgi:PheRS DNA binding domain 3